MESRQRLAANRPLNSLTMSQSRTKIGQGSGPGFAHDTPQIKFPIALGMIPEHRVSKL